jgi:Icc-related predicted phosphoesterase
MTTCFFVSDLHGRVDRYEKLASAIDREVPGAVFLGGDLLPPAISERMRGSDAGFIETFLTPIFRDLKGRLRGSYPRVFLILGNDDPRDEEAPILRAQEAGVWEYIHGRRALWGKWTVYGYGHVPPTPFLLKDWERYDVSRYVDPGCVSPEEGTRTVEVPEQEVRFGTIARDLEELAGKGGLGRALFLFHTPPYQTNLDRAALDGLAVDHAPLDVHIGSIAVRRFIEERQPRVTMHGHVHESARLTGQWRDRIGRTTALSGAHDGPELALVRFDPDHPESAERDLI